MDFDFSAILVLAVFVTGILWLLDIFVWEPKRKQIAAAIPDTDDNLINDRKAKALKEPVVVEYARSLFPVILLVLLLRSFIVEPFRIPSGSMMPTLLVGDFILVNKFSYGLRLPVLNTKFVSLGEPDHGDVVVFRYPKDPSTDYIKRIIGLPGDKVVYYDKRLFINGQLIEQDDKGTYQGVGSGVTMSGANLKTEHLFDADHQILIEPNRGIFEGVEFTVPQGHYFVMGDNRDNSNDSRYWGFVPEENLVGKAFLIWMNWDTKADGIDWSRIGNSIE